MSHWRDFIAPERGGSRYLPWAEVRHATGLSRTTAWRLQKCGDFPAGYKISPGRVGYDQSEIEAWQIWRRDADAPRPSAVVSRPTAPAPAKPRRAEERPATPRAEPAPRSIETSPAPPKPAPRRKSDDRQLSLDF